MILAELELWHSRPIAPTRRVALGSMLLPCEPPPGFGGLLLGGVVAGSIGALDPDLHPDLLRLSLELEDGRRIPQPRLRHRLQDDRIGLTRSRHVLWGEGDRLHYDLELEKGTPEQMVLGAVYAAGRLPPGVRHGVMRVLRQAMRWHGGVGPDLLAFLTGSSAERFDPGAFRDPVGWALGVLGMRDPMLVPSTDGDRPPPERRAVQRRFRQLLREAHPDHGGATDEAAQRIAELTEARRILLGA